MPYVGLQIWVSGNAQRLGPIRKDITLYPIASMLADGAALEDDADVTRIVSEAVLNGVGADAFFEQFKRAMQVLDDEGYEYSEIGCVQTATIIATTPDVTPYIMRHDILQPLVRMHNFHARTKARNRLTAWDCTYPYFE